MISFDSLCETITNKLEEKLGSRLSGAGRYLKLDNIPVRNEDLEEIIGDLGVPEFNTAKIKVKKEVIQCVVQKIIAHRIIEKEETKQQKIETDQELIDNISHLQILIDINKTASVRDANAGKYILDTKQDKILEVNTMLFLEGLHDVQRKYLRTNSTYCQSVFNTSKMESRYILEADDPKNQLGQPYTAINLYRAPFWRQLPLENKKLNNPLALFFEKFTPCEKSRHYLFQWLREMIFGRNATILVIVGGQGTGKGFLCEEIIPRLIGMDNWTKAQTSFVAKEFNAILRNKIYINVDEVKINATNYEKFKSYTAKKVNIEAKGKDAIDATDVHVNFIFTNNNWDSIYTTKNDRRLSVIDISELSTDDNFGSDIWDDIWYQCVTNERRSNEIIHEFGSFLYHYPTHDWDNHTPFRSKSFDRLVIESMTEWQRILYELLMSRSKPIYDLKILQNPPNKSIYYKIPSNLEIHDWLRLTFHNGKPIGTIIKDESSKRRQYRVVPCDDLLPLESSQDEEV